MTKREQEAIRKQGEKLKRRYERAYYATFYKALREQKRPVINAAKNNISAAYVQISLITSRPLDDAYKKMYYKLVPHEASREYARLQVQKSFGVSIDWLSDIASFLDRYLLNRIVLPMTGRTMERMYRALNNGIALGKSNDEIIKDLQDTELDKSRARLIARTEATRATNFATKLAGDKHDFKINRVWIAARDKRTRGGPGMIHQDDTADHYHMNGMEAADDDPFTDPRNGAQLMYPGDTTLGAPAASVCNCRCSCGQEPVRDADGNLVMK